MRRNSCLYAILFCLAALSAPAFELTGTISVDETSDTAASAKNKAFNSAQRAVIARELRSYANPEQLDAAIKNSSDEDLMNIISSSSLDSEKISDTSYSANISFVIDGDAARRWLDNNSVQHWLPASGTAPVVATTGDANSVVISANLFRPMADWMSLNSVARAAKVDLIPQLLVGNNVTFTVSDKNVSKFTSSLRANGWQVQSENNGFKIWK